MKISELPQEIKEKALKYQREAKADTDDLDCAFKWIKTEEGYDFWAEWCEKEPIKKDKIKMKITKKQVKQLDKGEVTVRELFPEVFETKLKVGKWYKHKYIGYIFCFNGVYEDYSQYGILSNGEWSENISSDKSNLIDFIPATEEEVKTALINEAKKRGYNKGLYVDFFGVGKRFIPFYVISYYYTNNSISLIHDDYFIFKDGIWAEIIETITKEEAEKILNKKIV